MDILLYLSSSLSYKAKELSGGKNLFMNTVKSDIHLWNAFKKGDVHAFDELYTQYYHELHPYALKICKNPDLAFDAIHNTYVYLWQNKEGLGQISALKFYLLRSVRHECLNLLKKQKQFFGFDRDALEFEFIIEPEDLVLKEPIDKSKQKIKEALGKLSQRQQEIIYLKFYNNLEYGEIAEILELNYQSVVNSIHRSMIKLRNENILSQLKDL